MGDVVIQTAFANWLKLKLPKSKITFLTLNQFEPLLINNLNIDEVIPYKKKKGLEDFNNLKKLSLLIQKDYKPDVIIDLHGTLRAKVLKLFINRIPFLSISKRSFRRFMFIKFKLNTLASLESNHERIIKDFSSLFHLDYSREDLEKFNNSNAITSIGKTKFSKDKTIIISPVASFAPKRWPINKFKTLIDQILKDSDFADYKIKLIGGPDDKYCNELQFEEYNQFENFQGKLSLAQTVDLISTSQICISNDTGMGHIAEANNVPVISIFGPTSESFGFAPSLKKSISISENIWCRPCSTDGKKACFRKEQYCMTNIEVDKVVNSLKNVLRGNNV